MKSRFPYFFLLIIILIVGILHFTGLYFYLYWRITSFDRLVHLLGGFFVAYASLSIIFLNTFIQKKIQVIMLGILSAVIIGWLWEFFELSQGITFFSDQKYWLDSLSDICFDILGGLIASFYFIKVTLR